MSLKSRILVVGVGQGGSNITKEFENMGYNTFYVNTSYDDIPLNTDDNRIYHIKNSQGCAKDRQKAINYAVDYYDDIINTINTSYPTCDIVFITFSLGGGTGSGIAPVLLSLLASKNLKKYYGAIAILPHKSESILVHSNARESLTQLMGIKDKLYSIHLLDNNKREDFLQLNQDFSQLFDSFIEFNEVTKKGNIDGEELEKLATDSGITVILEFENDDFKLGTEGAIKDSIYADWNGDCNYLGIILQDKNKKSDCVEILSENFGMPITDFTTFSENGNLVIATGMSFNASLPKRLATIAKEKLEKKQEIQANKVNNEKDDIELDLSSFKSKTLLNRDKKKSDEVSIAKDVQDTINYFKNIGNKK